MHLLQNPHTFNVHHLLRINNIQNQNQSFPRIFALLVNQSGKICDFGYKQGANWCWNIPLRRRLFDWELDQWDLLMALLSGFKSEGFDQDYLVWSLVKGPLQFLPAANLSILRTVTILCGANMFGLVWSLLKWRFSYGE
ncbi:hypothetical protein GQ457_03G023250 [Hibiscus cannabinus]